MSIDNFFYNFFSKWCCCGTTEATLKEKNNGNINSASKVGKLIAERALELGIQKVAFDRSGYKFHGRVKALAEAAREAGLSF